MQSLHLGSSILLGVASVATAQSPYVASVVYVNTPGHPTNVVPGVGLPFNAGGGGSSAFQRPWVSPNGLHWALNVAIESPSLQNDEAMLLDGNLVVREGALAPWPTVTAGEVVGQHFFSELGINDNGDLVFDIATGTPATPAPAATNDYFLRLQGGVWTVLAQESQPVNLVGPGLLGDAGLTATWDDNMDSGRLTNSGVALWRADGIDLLSTGTANDGVIVLGNGLSIQKGVTIPAGQVGGGVEAWEIFDTGDLYVALDGAITLIQGDLTGPTTTDDIVALNGVVVLQEGVPFGSFTSPVDANGVVKPWLDRAGNWYVRGDNVDQNDWVVRNGVVVAYSDGTDPIVPNSTEHWDDATFANCFFGFDGNSLGHYLIAGVTDNPNLNANAVIVFDDGLGGRFVAAREGDPIDLNGNGLFDDDRYLAVFGDDDMVLLDDGTILLLATLRDGTGTAVDHAFLRLTPSLGSCTFRNGSGVNPVACTCLTTPVVNTTFQIGLSSGPNTLATLLFADFQPIAPFPLFGGELLISPAAFPVPATLAIPYWWQGLQFSLQGVRLDDVSGSLTIVLTNAQDVRVGY